MTRKWLLAALAVGVGLVLLAGAAWAEPKPVTKIKFKLDAHEVPAGTDVTGSVRVWTRSNHAWTPFAGAALTVSVDGVEVGSITTDGDGLATVVYTTTVEGDHTMKVAFAEDDTHKKAKRAQGFTVTAAPV